VAWWRGGGVGLVAIRGVCGGGVGGGGGRGGVEWVGDMI